MASNCTDMGVEKHINVNVAMSEMSLLDEVKEEKAEDDYQLQQQYPQFKPMFGNGCESQQNQLNQTMEENNCSIDEREEQEVLELRKRLNNIRKRRRRIQQLTRIECIDQQDLLLRRLNSRRRERSEIVDEYLSAWKGRDSVALFSDCAKRWNVLNDTFSIWIDGKSAFATINGCRLGAEAAPLPSDLLIAARSQPETKSNGKWVTSTTNNATTNGNKQNVNSPPRRSLLGLFGGNDNANNVNNLSEKGPTIPTILEPIRVPWMEINAALGHACLLLKILQESFSKRGGNGMKFTHELHPMGATSKIGIRFGSGNGVLAAATGIGTMLSNGNSNENDAANTFTSPPVIYNLFFEEASGFSFFKNNNRNFNWALQAFLQCIAEAAAQQPDKTIAVPHAIRHEKASYSNGGNNSGNNDKSNYLNGGEWTIGGLSICYPSQQQGAVAGNALSNEKGGGLNAGGNTTTSATSSAKLEWTRACRFLLTDLKWLVAYASKHVDR